MEPEQTPHSEERSIASVQGAIRLVQVIAEDLVDHPERVIVHVQEQDQGVTINLAVDSSEQGKMIGKQGRTARAIRTFLMGYSMKAGIPRKP